MEAQNAGSQPSLEALLAAGVHFGHQTRRWNPKMRQFIFAERNGIHIIDLQKTLRQIELAQKMARDVILRGEQVLFVCTKPQLSAIVRAEAERSASLITIDASCRFVQTKTTFSPRRMTSRTSFWASSICRSVFCRSMMWIPLRSAKMNRRILGFQRRVWCPKWTPAARSASSVGWLVPPWVCSAMISL
jgi:hypothetical protein